MGWLYYCGLTDFDVNTINNVNLNNKRKRDYQRSNLMNVDLDDDYESSWTKYVGIDRETREKLKQNQISKIKEQINSSSKQNDDLYLKDSQFKDFLTDEMIMKKIESLKPKKDNINNKNNLSNDLPIFSVKSDNVNHENNDSTESDNNINTQKNYKIPNNKSLKVKIPEFDNIEIPISTKVTFDIEKTIEKNNYNNNKNNNNNSNNNNNNMEKNLFDKRQMGNKNNFNFEDMNINPNPKNYSAQYSNNNCNNNNNNNIIDDNLNNIIQQNSNNNNLNEKDNNKKKDSFPLSSYRSIQISTQSPIQPNINNQLEKNQIFQVNSIPKIKTEKKNELINQKRERENNKNVNIFHKEQPLIMNDFNNFNMFQNNNSPINIYKGLTQTPSLFSNHSDLNNSLFKDELQQFKLENFTSLSNNDMSITNNEISETYLRNNINSPVLNQNNINSNNNNNNNSNINNNNNIIDNNLSIVINSNDNNKNELNDENNKNDKEENSESKKKNKLIISKKEGKIIIKSVANKNKVNN